MKTEFKVQKTHDYNLFKSMDGNRTLNQLHLKGLKSSMEEEYLFTVILVNDKYEIIDGHHRFEVIKELLLPLYYIVIPGYSLNQIHRYNSNMKNWNSDDFMNGYADMGLKDYIKYREFKTIYGIGHNEAMILLTAGSTGNGDHFKDFKDGKFKIKNYTSACTTIEKIFSIQPHYDGYKRRSFIFAMIALFKNPLFDLSEFLHKLKLQPGSLVDCPSISSYINLIEEIYNYRRSNKVNLRYSTEINSK